MHAFIIEDDYLISQSIQELLTDIGFTAFSFARSEDAAIAGAAGESFDLITADSRLLPGDGLKAVEAICVGREIPVIFITGFPDELQGRLRGHLATAPIIRKPIREAEFNDAVRQVIGQAQD